MRCFVRQIKFANLVVRMQQKLHDCHHLQSVASSDKSSLPTCSQSFVPTQQRLHDCISAKCVAVKWEKKSLFPNIKNWLWDDSNNRIHNIKSNIDLKLVNYFYKDWILTAAFQDNDFKENHRTRRGIQNRSRKGSEIDPPTLPRGVQTI